MLLVEYGEPINVALTEKEAKKLRTASSNWRKKLRLKYSPISLKRTNLGKYQIRAKGIAGFISIDNIHIEIVPKFLFEGLDKDDWKTSMWRFLSYGKGFNLFENTRLGISDNKGISDLLAELFLASLKGAEEIGYAVSYKEASIQHDTVIGKLDPDYYDQLIPVTGSLNLLADELSYDNEINQMLKWAGLQLASNVESSELRKRLILWAEELTGVSNTKPNNLISPQRLNNYSHLKQAIEIAELLLEDINVNFSQDFANVPGFLWDSDALFERAMFRLFKEVLRKVDSRAIKKSLLLAHSPQGIKVTTIPDILFYKNNMTYFKILSGQYLLQNYFSMITCF